MAHARAQIRTAHHILVAVGGEFWLGGLMLFCLYSFFVRFITNSLTTFRGI